MRITTRQLILVAFFAALTALGAWLRIPLQPVPVTLQVFFTILAGAVLGPTLGALSQLIYILLGVIGLPVFAGGTHGLGALWGPTGGYLIGFVAAAYVIGFLVKKFELKSLPGILVSMLAGLFVIYLLGVFQLVLVLKLNFYKALMVGFFPFIAFDLVKAGLAAVVARRLGKLMD